MIGKEIPWYHAVICPALLMACRLEIPMCVYAHSFWFSNGQKMSKSLGNFLDLPTIQGYFDKYRLDAWRWDMAQNRASAFFGSISSSTAMTHLPAKRCRVAAP